MAVINVRKARAGTDSAGHRWPSDGAVVGVPVEHALALTRIPDGGFSIIDTPQPEPAVPASAEVAETVADDTDEAEPQEPEAKPRAAKAATRRA